MGNEKLIRWGLGFLVLTAGLVAFGKTVAPTVSFWDCGEFIAASACLGIPHPPGAPLYVLIGRIFTLLPLGDDIGYRVNLISVLTSALAGLVGYFIIWKLFELWGQGTTGRFWKYLAAVSGAITMLFSNTFWSSAVEAEVYGLSMLLMLLLIYLALRWYELRQTVLNPATGQTTPENGTHPDRYLILIYYLGLLSVAVHMTTFLVMPLIFLFVLWTDPEKRFDFRFWAAGGSLLIILAVVEPFLIAAGSTLAVSGAMYFFYGRKTAPWRLAFLLSVFGLLGFSSQLYIPIRSMQNPPIDENNPENWERFKGFLERKQYGQQNMLARALSRRGKLENQFGRYPRMGFWGFFETQYGKGGWAFVPVFLIGLAGLLLPFIKDRKDALFLLAIALAIATGLFSYFFLGLKVIGFSLVSLAVLAITWLVFKNSRARETALLLLVIVLAGTIGLVFYMNFADGTQTDAYGEAGLEVRDRGYFWTPGFVVFSLVIGIGLGYLGMLLSSEEIRQKLKRPLPQTLASLVVLMALGVPALALKTNYVRNSREGNFLPYDYAYNLLDSCDKEALLFTNGDNDTFPLWAVQDAFGFRKDVRNINLSLLNTDWYILQLKNHMGVPVSLADSQITMKDLPLPGITQTFPRPEYPYYDRRRGTSHYLMPVQLENQLLRVQDFMVEDIVLTNDFKFPLFFSRTVPSSSRVGLDANLKTEAMVLRLLAERTEERFDVERTEKLLWERFRFRNFNNPSVTVDDNEAGMMIVYPEIALELYEWYLKKNDTAKALTRLERAAQEFPFYPRIVVLLHDHYKYIGEPEKAKEVAERSQRHLEKAVRRSSDNPVWWMFLSNIYQLEGKKEEAYRAIQTAWEINWAEDYVFRTYVQYCMADGRTERLLQLARQWLENHPNDEFAQEILSQFGGASQLPRGSLSR